MIAAIIILRAVCVLMLVCLACYMHTLVASDRRLKKHRARGAKLLAELKPPPGFTVLAKAHEIIGPRYDHVEHERYPGPEFVIY